MLAGALSPFLQVPRSRCCVLRLRVLRGILAPQDTRRHRLVRRKRPLTFFAGPGLGVRWAASAGAGGNPGAPGPPATPPGQAKKASQPATTGATQSAAPAATATAAAVAAPAALVPTVGTPPGADVRL